MSEKKIAIFVEGQTEQIFMDRYLCEIADQKNITIERHQAHGGGAAGARTINLISARSATNSAKYFAMIVDCGGDSRVVSDVRDQYDSLVQSGYTSIVAIRDVYDKFTRQQIPRLRQGMRAQFLTVPFDPKMLLAVMEIEAWFLAEFDHYQKIHAHLTPAYILANYGFDPVNDDPTLKPHPFEDLDNIYRLVNRRYKKTRHYATRTVEALDIANVHFILSQSIPDLGELSQELDAFFT